MQLATALLAIGTGVFIVDLGLREMLGHAAFPGAAPLGGVGMIGGWLAVAAIGLRRVTSTSRHHD